MKFLADMSGLSPGTRRVHRKRLDSMAETSGMTGLGDLKPYCGDSALLGCIRGSHTVDCTMVSGPYHLFMIASADARDKSEVAQLMRHWFLVPACMVLRQFCARSEHLAQGIPSDRSGTSGKPIVLRSKIGCVEIS